MVLFAILLFSVLYSYFTYLYLPFHPAVFIQQSLENFFRGSVPNTTFYICSFPLQAQLCTQTQLFTKVLPFFFFFFFLIQQLPLNLLCVVAPKQNLAVSSL